MGRSPVRRRADALLVSLLLVLTACNQANAVKSRIECFVDDNGDKDDPNNIYRCAMTERCCKESAKPTCCRDKPMEQSIEDQLKLWGAVAGIILIVAIVMFYCRHDGSCCSNKKDGSTRCCGRCCPKRKMEEGYITKEQEANGIIRPDTPRPPKNIERPPPYDDLAFETT